MAHNLTTRDTLLRIARENGGLLRADDVVREAADAASPLHGYFEWDDTEAAYQWRLQQARQLIRTSIQILQVNQDPRPVQVFVSLTTDRPASGGGYRVAIDVLNDAGYRAQLLEDALSQMTHFVRKYYELRELASVFSAMAQAQQQLQQPSPQTPPQNPPPGFGQQDNGGQESRPS